MFSSIAVTPMACAFVFILGDLLTGFMKAIATKSIESTIMKSGLWHKAASIALVVTSLICATACQSWELLPRELVAVYPAVCVYICLMELVSILENICEVNPELKATKIFDLFNIDKKE